METARARTDRSSVKKCIAELRRVQDGEVAKAYKWRNERIRELRRVRHVEWSAESLARIHWAGHRHESPRQQTGDRESLRDAPHILSFRPAGYESSHDGQK